jgi:hypothetical protein
MGNRKYSRKSTFWKKQAIVLMAISIVSVIISGCGNTTATANQVPAKRILFIGNSYTDINGGVDKHIMGLAPNTHAARIAPGGVNLEGHWCNANTLNAIHTGRWDFVVLQEQSQAPIFNTKNFFEYAGRLNSEIKKAGAETVLFMTWERPDSVQYGVTTVNLSKTFTSFGQQLGVKVAPVGSAFSRSLQERPGLKLYSFDGHPTLQGTYLVACVFYGIIFKRSPVGNPYFAGLSDADEIYLQRIAAQTLGY